MSVANMPEPCSVVHGQTKWCLAYARIYAQPLDSALDTQERAVMVQVSADWRERQLVLRLTLEGERLLVLGLTLEGGQTSCSH